MSISSLILKFHFLRKSLITRLLSNYYHELNISLPIRSGYWVRLLENDAYDSFSEIFLKQEYLDFLPDEKATKILDIGAHYGYFSLWFQSIHPDHPVESLMIEPSERSAKSLESMRNDPFLKGRFKYLKRAIADTSKENVKFYERPYMAGSSLSLNKKEAHKIVKVLTPDEVFEKMQPPFDIIKCDIEGAEWEFLNYYSNIVTNAKFVLLEWHSWHSGGGGQHQLRAILSKLGFSQIKNSRPDDAVFREGQVGLMLFKNTSLLP